jgi:hypothetical protein
MADEPYSELIAVGSWLYDGSTRREIELTARPANWAASRWMENERGGAELNEAAPIPQTPDGRVYYVGTTEGGEFATADEAMAWADTQPWGPVDWRTLMVPRRRPLGK